MVHLIKRSYNEHFDSIYIVCGYILLQSMWDCLAAVRVNKFAVFIQDIPTVAGC